MKGSRSSMNAQKSWKYHHWRCSNIIKHIFMPLKLNLIDTFAKVKKNIFHKIVKYFVIPDEANAAMNDHANTTKENCSESIPITTCKI